SFEFHAVSSNEVEPEGAVASDGGQPSAVVAEGDCVHVAGVHQRGDLMEFAARVRCPPQSHGAGAVGGGENLAVAVDREVDHLVAALTELATLFVLVEYPATAETPEVGLRSLVRDVPQLHDGGV